MLLLLLACTPKARLRTETKQSGATLEVKIEVDPPAEGTLTFKGNPTFEKLGPQKVSRGQSLTLSVPVGGLPVGANNIAMHFEGEGRGPKTDQPLTFDRKAATPEMRFTATASKAGGAMLPCTGGPCMASTLPFGADGKMYVDISNCDGCTVEAGSQKLTVKGDAFPAAIDMMNAIAGVSVVGSTGISNIKIPFKVTQGSDSGESSMEGTASTLLTPILKRVAQGPLPITGDTPKPAPKAAILVRNDAGLFFRAVGATTVRDADLIGIVAVSTKTLGSCGIYEGTVSKQKVDVSHTGETYDITMYDRRTGKNVARRSFPYQDKGCADTLVAKTVTSSPNEEQITAWVKSLFK